MHIDEPNLTEFKKNLQSLYSDLEYIEKMVSYALFELSDLLKQARKLEELRYAGEDSLAVASSDE